MVILNARNKSLRDLQEGFFNRQHLQNLWQRCSDRFENLPCAALTETNTLQYMFLRGGGRGGWDIGNRQSFVQLILHQNVLQEKLPITTGFKHTKYKISFKLNN